MTLNELGPLLNLLSEREFPVTRLMAMLTIKHYGSPIMTLLAESLHHTTSAATGIVDRLEKDGMVVRSHVKGDRRKITVALTDKGKSSLESLAKSLSQLKA